MNTTLRTDIPVPRNYGLTIDNDASHFITPAAHLIAGFLILEPTEKRMLTREYQKYKAQTLRDWRSGKKWTRKAPAFQLGKKEKKILEGNLFEILEEKVKAQDGTMALIRAGAETAIRKAVIYSDRVFAEVKSLTATTSTGGRAAYHSVIFGGLALDEQGKITYKEAACDCAESKAGKLKTNTTIEDERKETRIHCKHLASVEELVDLESRGVITGIIKREEARKLPRYTTMPFTFFDARNRHVDELMIDVIVAKYVLGNNLMSINERLLDMPEIYRQHVIKMLENGNVKFKGLRQDNVDIEKPQRTHYDNNGLSMAIKSKLSNAGYEYGGLGLEFKETRYEALCARYTKDDTVIAVYRKKGIPTLLIERRLLGEIEMYGKTDYKENVFDKVYPRTRYYTAIDDATRQKSRERILVPGTVPKDHLLWKVVVPTSLKKVYGNIVNH